MCIAKVSSNCKTNWQILKCKNTQLLERVICLKTFTFLKSKFTSSKHLDNTYGTRHTTKLTSGSSVPTS